MTGVQTCALPIYYNPSGFCKNEKFYGVLRGEDKIINTLEELFTQQCNPYIFNSERKFLTKVELIGFNTNERIEDFRVFEHDNKFFCSFVFIEKESWDKNRICKQGLGYLDFENKTLTKLKIYDSPFNKEQEKNWGFFSLRNELFFIYSVSPWLVYKINKDFSIGDVVSYDNLNYHSHPIINNNFISISSLPINYSEKEMICFVHTKEKGVYYQTILLLDKTSLEVTYLCPEVILQGGKEEGNKKKKGILYISGLAIDNDTVVIYYGEADTSACMYKISKEEFNKLILNNGISKV
mgnify:FL=1